jgi:rSAM/selenodomain-associated transferase 2
MPVLNEAKTLRHTLSRLNLSDDEELIVVDGGSSDDTMSIAREFSGMVFEAKTGRASVMNYGAGKADGDILLFLHADCILPDNGFRTIRETLRDREISAGAFYLGIVHPKPVFRIIELGANLRSRISSLIYGDQGMFLRKDVFNSLGGFVEMPLMEDIEISTRLKKLGKIALVKPAIKSSPRRWLEEGAIYTTVRDWSIAFSYSFLKTSPEKLIKHYRDIR